MTYCLLNDISGFENVTHSWTGTLGGMAKTSRESIGYLPVSISTLLPESVLGVRLYIRESESAVPRLYRAAGVPFEQKDRDRLINRGFRCLFINAGENERYQAYLRDNLSTVLGNEQISVTERFASLNSVVRDVLAGSFRSGDVDASVRDSEKLAAHCVDLLKRDDCVATELRNTNLTWSSSGINWRSVL